MTVSIQIGRKPFQKVGACLAEGAVAGRGKLDDDSEEAGPVGGLRCTVDPSNDQLVVFRASHRLVEGFGPRGGAWPFRIVHGVVVEGQEYLVEGSTFQIRHGFSNDPPCGTQAFVRGPGGDRRHRQVKRGQSGGNDDRHGQQDVDQPRSG